ncbi:hypothetical protein ACET3Z_005202 [Daucus carota]
MKQNPFGGLKPAFVINNPDFVYSQTESVRDIDQSFGENSGSYYTDEFLKIFKGFDLERRAAQEDEMSTGDEELKKPNSDALWMSGGSSIDAKFRDIELTLSIGGSSGKKRLESHKSLKLDKSREVQSSCIIKGEELSDSRNTPKASSSKNKEIGKQNHWGFQDLSLSRT